MSKLDRAWVNCLRMWKWIADNHGKYSNVIDLKRKWLKQNRFKSPIKHDCFFCGYSAGQGDSGLGPHKTACPNCPARLVSERFGCTNPTYDYASKPKAFYKKLLELNKKRLSA